MERTIFPNVALVCWGQQYVWENPLVALEQILQSIDRHLRIGNDLMAANRETLTEVKWELQLSRATSERLLEQQDDLRTFLRDQITRIDRLGRPQARALERVEESLRALTVEIRALGGSSA